MSHFIELLMALAGGITVWRSLAGWLGRRGHGAIIRHLAGMPVGVVVFFVLFGIAVTIDPPSPPVPDAVANHPEPPPPPPAPESPKAPPPIGDYVQGLSGSIQSVQVQQILFGANGEIPDPPLYFVEATLKRNFTWGSAQDWNGLASTVATLTKPAFDRPDLARLRIKVVDGSGADWAYVDYRRNKLPKGWRDLDYLRLFAAADVSGGYLQSITALCEFYVKYQSAKPKGETGCR